MTTPVARIVLMVALAASGLSAVDAPGDVPSPGTGVHDWPQQGRTIYRDFTSRETGLPESFDVGDEKRPSANIRWVVKLGTTVMGVPIIANGKVFIASGAKEGCAKYPHDSGGGTGMLGALYCLDERTGEMLWQFIGPGRNGITVGQYGLVTAPVVEQDRVYLFGGRLHVICLTTAGLSGANAGPFIDEAGFYGIKPPYTLDRTDADIVWICDIQKHLSNIHYHNAYSYTPLVYGDYVYASTGNGATRDFEFNDTNHPPRVNADVPCFMVLDKRTGALVAVDDEKMGRGMIHGQWGTPCVGMVKGQAQILFGGGDGVVYAFDPVLQPKPGNAVGVLKKRWSFDPNVHLGDRRRFEIYGPPVCDRNRVFCATSDDWTHKKVGGILVCIDATGSGDVTRTGKVWEYRGIGISEGGATIAHGLVYAADLNGRLHCLDEDTGTFYWSFDMKGEIHATAVVADGKVYLGNSRGEFFIFREGKKLELLFHANLKGAIHTPCSIADGCLFIVAGNRLCAIGR